jgi:hypothetical protein
METIKVIYVNSYNKPEDGSLTWAETCRLKYVVKVKVNFTLEQAMKAQIGGRGTSLLFP